MMGISTGKNALGMTDKFGKKQPKGGFFICLGRRKRLKFWDANP